MRISDWSSDVCSSDLLLRLAAEGEDRMDDQRCLDAHRRAIARIDALDLARDQPVGDMAEPRTAETLGHHCAEQTQCAHFGHDLAIETLLAIGAQDTRHQFALRVRARGAGDALQIGRAPSELQSLMRISYAVFCLKKKTQST